MDATHGRSTTTRPTQTMRSQHLPPGLPPPHPYQTYAPGTYNHRSTAATTIPTNPPRTYVYPGPHTSTMAPAVDGETDKQAHITVQQTYFVHHHHHHHHSSLQDVNGPPMTREQPQPGQPPPRQTFGIAREYRLLVLLLLFLPIPPFISVLYLLVGHGLLRHGNGASHKNPWSPSLLSSANAAATGGVLLSLPIFLMFFALIHASMRTPAPTQDPQDDFFEDDDNSSHTGVGPRIVTFATYFLCGALLLCIGALSAPLGVACLPGGGPPNMLSPGNAAEAGIVGGAVLLALPSLFHIVSGIKEGPMPIHVPRFQSDIVDKNILTLELFPNILHDRRPTKTPRQTETRKDMSGEGQVLAEIAAVPGRLIIMSPQNVAMEADTVLSQPSFSVAQVSARLADGAKQSWELGTRAQSILEMNATRYSVLSVSSSLPPPSSISDSLSSPLQPFFQIAHDIVDGRAKSNGNITGPQPLIKDGSAADPSSIGFAVLLANWTGQGGEDYASAAKDQLDYLEFNVPRTSDGAISHRVSQVQLWSDFVYMVPPFLAYYGMISQNRTLLLEAYNQIKLYRSHLQDTSAGNLWKHVLLGASGNDEGHWSTGNAWAAAGMLRVLGTYKNSEFANTLKNEQKDLAAWTLEIHAAMYPHLDSSSNLFPNYASQPPTAEGNFLDASSTALLASTVYRLSLIRGTHTYLPFAERTRKALSAANTDSSSNSSLQHFDADGWLTPVVNPHSYGQQGSQSPEGQAFVVEMQAAWRDWVADGSKGANGATGLHREIGLMGWGLVLLGMCWGALL
ncbi:hypothetical protein DXG01_004128 [Tephrocybe rancida]|nr:hypothetical protein DXG01_004128 [Tephrocybe rancida]